MFWERISKKFAQYPAQRQVARKMIELGLRIGDGGAVMCGEVEVTEVSLARAAGVDRRMVRAAVSSILSDSQMARLFRAVRPAGVMLDTVARELGYGAVEIAADAKAPGIIAAAATLLAKRKISIRQAYARDPELFENPTLVIVTEKPIPGSLLPQFAKIKGVKKVSIT